MGEEEQKIPHDEEVDKKENMEPALESKEEDEENLSQEDEMALRELIDLIAEEKISPDVPEEKKENIDIAPELETREEEEEFKPDEAAEKKENIDTAPEMKTRALEDITPDAAKEKKEMMEEAPELKTKKEEESDEMDLSQADEMVLRELINLIAAEKFTPDAAAEKKEVEDAAPELETRKKKEEESVEMDLSQNEVDLRKLSNLVAKEVITPDEEEKKENIETAPEQKEEAREAEKFTQVAAAEKKENVEEAPEPKIREEDTTSDVAADRREILEEVPELKTRNEKAEK